MKLVMIFSKDCKACLRFKKDYLESLYSKIKNLNVEVIQIDLNSRDKFPSSVGKMKIPASLWNYVRYFPTFILLSDSSWADPDRKPENILIYGSIVNKNGKVSSVGIDEYTDSSVSKWIESNLKLKEKRDSLPKKIMTEKR